MNSYANDTSKNKRFPAEDYFFGERLEMGKAIYQNDKNKVEKLLKQGINVNALSENNDGFTYLMYSIFLDNRYKIAELLLQHNADPNLVSYIYFPKYKQKSYYLPLTFSAESKSIEDMQLLLKYGAKANYTYINAKGEKPLHAMYPINAAVRSAYILNKWSREDFMNDIKARIDLLLKHGADINSIGSMGKSVVEWADSNAEIVLYLMDKGAYHRIYGKKLLKDTKLFSEIHPKNNYLKEIIRRLEALGYE